MLFGHRNSTGMQVARAGVVAEPGPEFEHVVELGRGQITRRRPARQEPLIIGRDRFDRGLLQHDLGQPDAVRIGCLAGQCAPRQATAMTVIPGEQGGRIGLVPASVLGVILFGAVLLYALAAC